MSDLGSESSATESTGKTFQLGLALSGAISAGAYTAGVLDFLFQALDEWEKQRGQPGVPDHRVVLKVVTGASAGAITGALGAIALARGLKPKDFTPDEVNNAYRTPGTVYQTLRCVLPSLYDTWVTYPSLVAPEGKISFLTEEDLKKQPQQVQSLLNSQLLDWIKRQALLCPADADSAFKPAYGYVADTLHVYLTFSNLRGMSFRVPFGNGFYDMQTHGDRVHYIVTDLGGRTIQDSQWVSHDKGIPLSVTTLPPYGEVAAALEKVPYVEWNTYGDCALASAAFPIGLAPRKLAFPIGQYLGRNYPLKVSKDFINPNFPPTFLAAGKDVEFGFLNVDGGLINNNPFDYAQFTLMGGASAEKTQGQDADKAVIMVSPFPEAPAFLPDDQPAAELVAVVRALYPTLINQVRFKVEELAPAADVNDLSRFLIAPERNLNGVEQRYTIACGLLGGFGGFLDERFRAHDFQLGRRNCQRFLTAVFSLPGSNDIAVGMEKLGTRFLAVREAADQPETYVIVPLFGSAVAEVPLPHWPRMTQGAFDTLLTQIASRLKAVGPVLIRAQTTNRVLRTLALIGLTWSGDRLRQYISRSILSDLVRRDQIEGWDLPALPDGLNPDDARAVLAELINPAFDLRTAASIAERTHLEPRAVTAVLERLRKAEPGKPFLVSTAGERDGEALYTLPSQLSTIARVRARVRGWPVVGSVERALEPLGID